MPPVKRAVGNWSGGGRKRAVKNKLAGGIVRWRRLILALLLLACPTVMRFFLLFFDNEMARRDKRLPARRTKRRARRR